jgi:adenine-specific DNA-methyltransferase
LPKKYDYSGWSKEDLIKRIHELEKRKKYGLVWDEEREPEKVVLQCKKELPVLKEVKEKEIKNDPDKPTHILIEGDNYHALSVLNYTHENSVDVIYIDPPYNTGEDEFKYNDKYVNAEDGYRHSKWLSFMEHRLKLAKNLLKNNGVIIIHIDEHELDNLFLLLSSPDLFGEKNNLGRIIWDKRNPKGDSKGVSILNETILIFAKNRDEFLKMEGALIRPKPNAQKILDKAKRLYAKLGKKGIPDEIAEVIKPFDFPRNIIKEFEVEYDLDLINKEFKYWIRKQDFSEGEKAYCIIDNDGRVYQSVSMAWPNKKKAPEDYFIPLIHPITNKPCPVPRRGWRYPSATMKKLLDENKIIFGKDEKVQPRQKYFLEENLFENVPSILSYGASDEKFFQEININFPYAKPIEVAKYLLSNIHPNPITVVDFFAGSGTALHAVAELNFERKRNTQCILVTNNENNICEEVCLPRINYILNGYNKSNGNEVNGLKENLKYFKTNFINSKPTDKNKEKLTQQSVEMLCLRENTFDPVVEEETIKIFQNKEKYTAILFDQLKIPKLKNIIRDYDKHVHVYIFSLGDDDFADEFSDMKEKVTVKSIPAAILRVYRRIFK